ncbi:MAG: TonB-dependent receptor [Sandaracinaceae bacterium]|nr:TonB-dependent receptor [Sandaracinaceae bacterium]
MTTVGGDLRFRYGAARPADYTDYVTGDGPFTVRLPYWKSRSVIGAVFVQQVLRLHERVAANLGARFDADSLFGVRLSPRAALIFSPTDRSTLRLGYSEAFRAPSAQELNDSDPTYTIQPERLNAETVRTADVEFAQRFSRGSFSLRVFGSIYEDLVVQRYATQAEFDAALMRGQLVPNAEASGASVWANSDVIRAVGGTVSARGELVEGLDLAMNLTLAFNELRGAGRLPILPAFYGNARIAYRFGEEGPTLGLVARFSSARPAYLATDDGSAPLGTVSGLGELRLTASGPIAAVPGLHWRAFVNASLSRLQPYLYNLGPTAEDPNNTRAFQPNPRLFAFIGVHYDLP